MKVHKSFRLEETLVQQLDKLALEQNRNLSNLVETILLNFLTTKSKTDG